MRRVFVGLLLLTWIATGAETIDVHIGSDSDRAAAVLLDELNKKGAEQDFLFRLNEDEFTIKFIVTWRRGGRATRGRGLASMSTTVTACRSSASTAKGAPSRGAVPWAAARKRS